jgi:hypothetical protein
MNGEGIMALPQDMGMGMPQGGINELESLNQAQQVTKDLGINKVSKELLSAGADVDPYEVKAFLDDHVERTGNPLDPYDAAAIVASRFVDRNQDWQDAVGEDPTLGYWHTGGAGDYYDNMAREAINAMAQREKNKK